MNGLGAECESSSGPESLFGFFNWSSLLLDGMAQMVPLEPVF